MPRYIAFLRAINVGGHTVKMERLQELFEAMDFENVETFIASGNVIFEAASGSTSALESKIEAALEAGLGYKVATFLRTPEEVAAVAEHKPFPQAELDAATALNVAFLADTPSQKATDALMALKSDIDDFKVHKREVYWKCLKKQSESKFSNTALEKAMGIKSTLRGVNTVQKIAAKYKGST